MILMVCGTQKFPLNRMLEQMDALVEAGVITETVFAQIGYSTYRPKHYAWAEFVEGDAFEEMIRNCDLLLTHGGVGTILTGKEFGKPVLVYPRSARYGEHVDDHQWQIAKAFGERGYVQVCGSAEEMAQAITRCKEANLAALPMGENVQTDVIRNFLRGKLPVRK